MERKGNGKALRGLWDKYKYALAVAAVGIVLLVWPAGGGDAAAAVAAVLPAEEVELETRMEAVLSKIEGVGELALLLSVEESTGTQYAQDTELSYRGATSAPDDYSRRSTTVVVSGDGGDGPVPTGRISPVYRGALVVCQGAGNAEVRLAVTQAVAALTGLGSDRITVVKCQ